MAAVQPLLVAIGDNCLDVYLTKAAMTVGGNALNVAAHWRRAGGAARYLGAVGTDAEAAVILEEIEKAGLDSGDVERRPGRTAVTLLSEEAGDRRFLLEDLGVGRDYLPPEESQGVIAAADWVHLGTNANPDLVRRLVAGRVRFSIDVSTAHDAMPLAGVPMVFASGPDDPDAAVAPIADRLHRAGARDVVVTCGSRGAYFRADEGTLLHAPATPVAVVDTCGAGDSFIASFLAGFAAQRPVAAALHEAAATASQACRYVGGFPQAPRTIPDWLLEKYAAVIDA
ncbi:PfkB family carbohydrate kinase [Dongia sp. agr-C8]